MSRSVGQVLQSCGLFAQVDPSRRESLAAHSIVHNFDKGHLIVRQGQACPGIYVVDSGMVRVFKIGPNAKEHVLHMVGPGQTFVEVAALGGFGCPACAEAITNTRCVLIPIEPFRHAIETDHQLCLEMMAGLSFWVRHLVSLLEDVVLRDAVGRVACFLVEAERAEDGTVKLPGLKRHIASHLNLTSETFSRTFGRLIEAGLVVELDSNRVELRDPERLHEIAEGRSADF